MKKLILILIVCLNALNVNSQDRINESEYTFVESELFNSILWIFNDLTGKWEATPMIFQINSFYYKHDIFYTISKSGIKNTYYPYTKIVKETILAKDFYVFSKTAFCDFLIGKECLNSFCKYIQVPDFYDENKTIRYLMGINEEKKYILSKHYNNVFRFFPFSTIIWNSASLSECYYEISESEFKKLLKILQNTIPELKL